MTDAERITQACRLIGLLAAGELPSSDLMNHGKILLDGLMDMPLTLALAQMLMSPYKLPADIGFIKSDTHNDFVNPPAVG
jgi:hypothetical protein